MTFKEEELFKDGIVSTEKLVILLRALNNENNELKKHTFFNRVFNEEKDPKDLQVITFSEHEKFGLTFLDLEMEVSDKKSITLLGCFYEVDKVVDRPISLFHVNSVFENRVYFNKSLNFNNLIKLYISYNY